MPDRIDLDERLAHGKATLLADIAQPAIERVGARAAAIRRRRRAARIGAAFAVVAAVAMVVRPNGGPVPQVAEPPAGRAPVYSDGGITVNGIPDPAAALDLPGTVVDVEFADPEHGYAVSACEGRGGACRPGFARTTDGGRSWTSHDLPDQVAGRSAPELVAFRGGRVLVRAGAQAYAWDDAGERWEEVIVANVTEPAYRDDELLRLRAGGADCAGGGVEIWTPDFAPRGPLAAQPDLDVCWVAGAESTGDTWWVGGTANGRAAVAVTGDSGRSWRRYDFDLTGTARVAALGPHVYALVSDRKGRLRAVYHSADRGVTFERTGGTGLPQLLAGDPIALLDGRLLVVEQNVGWLVSADDGRTFRHAQGTLPAVGRLAATRAGYVAYDLFQAGWSAFSTDGSTWRKLELR